MSRVAASSGRAAAAGKTGGLVFRIGLTAMSYFLMEAAAMLLLDPVTPLVLGFGLLWAGLLTTLVWMLPRLAGRIVYGVTYFAAWGWMLAQTGYVQLFQKLMWVSDILLAGEGADYFNVILSFSWKWWLSGAVLLALGVVTLLLLPKRRKRGRDYLIGAAAAAVMIGGLFAMPEAVFLHDLDVWGTRSEYAQSSSFRACYNTMYDAQNVYDICGFYQLTFRDIWKHHLYPLTPAYRREQTADRAEIDAYFDARPDHEANDMTGTLAGKNVILVLMESMDDWLITPEDTPTLYRMMGEGISFTNFYTPGYGSARTINSEFCMNTGIYLPTNGKYVFSYVTNTFSQSLASRLTAAGYTAEEFHYNTPDFYSRGVFAPAMGYRTYNSYAAYTSSEDELFDDCYLFDSQELSDLFFREGPTFNFIVTRSAHLSYVYNEVLSHYALKRYPDYRGKYGDEEVDCARVKARLVDDLFTRMLAELESRGQLENTVIIGVTDHYTYGFKDTAQLLELSGADDVLELEKTPCFVWSADLAPMNVTKTLNTADVVPTVLNLLGMDPGKRYLGQDAFDSRYAGYAFFPDGSWISDGVICKAVGGGMEVLQNTSGKPLSEEEQQRMLEENRAFVRISNLLLTTDYYRGETG